MWVIYQKIYILAAGVVKKRNSVLTEVSVPYTLSTDCCHQEVEHFSSEKCDDWVLVYFTSTYYVPTNLMNLFILEMNAENLPKIKSINIMLYFGISTVSDKCKCFLNMISKLQRTESAR